MKKVVIMGASSGIGLAVAEALASRGVMVGVAARNTAALEKLQNKYPEFVKYATIDINSPEAVEQLGGLINRLGGMDIYFHVSGIGYENPSLLPHREVEMIETNACGFARMVSTAYRYFRDRHDGRPGQIAAITSVAGTNGIGRAAAYSASKAFDRKYLVALEQLANIEGVRVDFTDIRPGWIRTPLLTPGKPYPMEMSLEYVVPAVIKAIVRKKRVAVVDWRWSLLSAAWSLLPDRLWVRLPVEL